MTKLPHILVAGSINIDIVCLMERAPEAGETTVGREYAFIPGGKGANQAVACARLQAVTHMAGRLGNDAFGVQLRAALRADNVNTSHVLVDETANTGMASIWVEQNGSNRIAVFPGANWLLTPAAIEDAFDSTGFDACITQFEIPAETVVTCSNEAYKRSVPFFLDAGLACDFPLEDLEPITVFSPNETETAALCGIRPDDEHSACEAAKRLFKRCRCEAVVIKMGGKGAFLYTADDAAMIPGFSVAAVDTTAAGDAFTAALCVRWLETADWHQAVRFANAVGALTVTKRGAQPSLPYRSEVNVFLKM
jgi:ribokinase